MTHSPNLTDSDSRAAGEGAAAPSVPQPEAWLCGGSLFHSYAAIPGNLLPPVGSPVPLYARPTPAAGVPPDDALEVMIAASDGHWREDVFCIGGPELMDLLRHVGRAALSAGDPSSLQGERNG